MKEVSGCSDGLELSGRVCAGECVYMRPCLEWEKIVDVRCNAVYKSSLIGTLQKQYSIAERRDDAIRLDIDRQ